VLSKKEEEKEEGKEEEQEGEAGQPRLLSHPLTPTEGRAVSRHNVT